MPKQTLASGTPAVWPLQGIMSHHLQIRSLEASLQNLRTSGDEAVQRVCKFALGLLHQSKPYARRSNSMWSLASKGRSETPQSNIAWSDMGTHRLRASSANGSRASMSMSRSNSEFVLRTDSLLRFMK